MLFSTGERRTSFARKENNEKDKKTAENETHQMDCSIRAAESFSGMEEMTPHEISASARTESRQMTDERLPRVGAHCFGNNVDCIRAATPQCRVFTPWVLCPLVTASYAKTRD
jgi:hypothetical protein